MNNSSTLLFQFDDLKNIEFIIIEDIDYLGNNSNVTINYYRYSLSQFRGIEMMDDYYWY